jgi:hypothetical protein
MFALLRRSPQFGIAALSMLAAACAVLGSGQSVGVRGYRLVDEDTLSVLTTTAAGYETWVSSVQENPNQVVVEVRFKAPVGAGAPGGQDLWLTVDLKAPLGDRSVIDAAGDSVPVVPEPNAT